MDVFISCLQQRPGESWFQHLPVSGLCMTKSLRNNEGGGQQEKDVPRSQEHIAEGFSDPFNQSQSLPATVTVLTKAK